MQYDVELIEQPVRYDDLDGLAEVKRSVSIGNPGPTTMSHQPDLPVTGLTLATCWSPVKAWQIKIALLRSLFNVP